MAAELTWLGHGTWSIAAGGHHVLLDPFLDDSPVASVKADEVEADFILVSHGHFDHTADVEKIAKRTGATVIACFEICEWFRAKGIENVPPGRVLLIANHAGQIPIDAAMVGTAMILEGEPPRAVRAMGEFWLPQLPWINIFLHRVGGVVGTPKNCVDLLNNEEAVEVFPEGVRGVSKLIKDRYKLARFGLGFMRLALQTNTPIVPVGIVGSEEQAPSLANIKPLARLLNMPAFPITPTWPFLGPLGLIPLPARYYIHFGKPMVFEGDPDDEDHHIESKVDKVKTQIARLINAGKRQRKSIFL